MAELRTDPFLIDINVTSSLEMQKHMIDYVDLITAFPDETVMSNEYWHMDSHSDPISSKIDFFKKLDKGELNLSEMVSNKPPKTDDEKLYNKNIRDQLTDELHLTTDDGIYGKPTVSGDQAKAKRTKFTKTWIPVKESVTHEGADGRWSVEKLEPEEVSVPVMDRTQMQQEATEVQTAFGMKDMSPWFIMWWLEKFNSSHRVIIKDLREVLGEDNEYFVKFSDSVGQLKNMSDTYDDSTIPMYDTSVEAYGDNSIPSKIPSVTKYNTKPETISLAVDLAKETTEIYRTNMFCHLDDASRDTVVNKLAQLPTESHGVNMMNDAEHPKRILKFMDIIREEIQKHLKGLYDVLEFLSTKENYMVVGKPRQILMKVESHTQAMDLFKNKIKLLNVPDNTLTASSRYGKSSYINNRSTNAQYLAVDGVKETPSEDQSSS